ncbi:MAG: hypothetical protein ACTSQ2_11640 [Candidatus Heimdallarchaeaceae archaeon]
MSIDYIYEHSPYDESSGMKGPYRLIYHKVDEVVTRCSPGNYLLGYIRKSVFYVRYVGRSDNDLNSRLKTWCSKTLSPLSKDFQKSYTHFS